MMTFTTAKSMEETLELWITPRADRSGVWINRAQRQEDDGEAVKRKRNTLWCANRDRLREGNGAELRNNQLTSLNVSNNTVLTFLVAPATSFPP